VYLWNPVEVTVFLLYIRLIFASHHPCKKPRSLFLNGKSEGHVSTCHIRLTNTTTMKYYYTPMNRVFLIKYLTKKTATRDSNPTFIRSPNHAKGLTNMTFRKFAGETLCGGGYVHFHCIDQGELHRVIQIWSD
jgi:hypothetical protein